jgi:hypothetical protein
MVKVGAGAMLPCTVYGVLTITGEDHPLYDDRLKHRRREEKFPRKSSGSIQ